MHQHAYPQRPTAISFRRFLTTQPGSDLASAAGQLSAELAAKDVALAMARNGEPEDVQPDVSYERDTTFSGDYSDLVVAFPDHHALTAFTAELGEAAWEARVRWLPDTDPPDAIQITRTDDGLPADFDSAREAIRGVSGCPLVLEEIEPREGEPVGRFETWLPDGFPDERVAYFVGGDWAVEVVSRGHERPASRGAS